MTRRVKYTVGRCRCGTPTEFHCAGRSGTNIPSLLVREESLGFCTCSIIMFSNLNGIDPKSSLRITLIALQIHCVISHTEGNVCPSFKKVVPKCPTSDLDYENNAKGVNCSERCGSEYHYHCIRDHRMETLYEICAPKIKISGHCAEYNIGGQLVQNDHDVPYHYPCHGRIECPVYINSTDIYKYPDCLNIKHPPKPIMPWGPRDARYPRRNPHPHPTSDKTTKLPIILICVIIGTALVVIIPAFICYEKYKTRTSWMEALRRVRRCIMNALLCRSNDNENALDEPLTEDSA